MIGLEVLITYITFVRSVLQQSGYMVFQVDPQL